MSAHVVIVGAQPVGLCTALALAKAGIEVTVIDPADDDTSSCQYVHSWCVLPELARLGVLADARAAGAAESQVRIHLADTGENIDFDLDVLRDDVEFPFNLHLGEDGLSSVLIKHLSEYRHTRLVRAERIASITQDQRGVVVDIDSRVGRQTFRGDWLVGADGTRSAVRRLLGVGFRGFTWRERSVTALVRGDLGAAGCHATTFYLGNHHGDDRTSALLQRSGPGEWVCAYSEPIVRPEESIGTRVDNTIRRVSENIPVTTLGWRTARMHRRTADTYRVGRVLLAGAAAHVTTRITGHSSIPGFFDAFRLAEALQAVIHDAADTTVLDNYAESRRRVFIDDAAPLSTGRKLLLSDDPRHLGDELDRYRSASLSRSEQRELLLAGGEPAGIPTVFSRR